MTGFSPKTRRTVLDRSGGICELCGVRPVDQLHHRRPRGSGGSKRDDTNTPANCFAICEPDHRHLESHRTEALDNGWLVRQGRDPEHVPLLYRRTHFVILSADGGLTYV